jgi:hypothetical protein
MTSLINLTIPGPEVFKKSNPTLISITAKNIIGFKKRSSLQQALAYRTEFVQKGNNHKQPASTSTSIKRHLLNRRVLLTNSKAL